MNTLTAGLKWPLLPSLVIAAAISCGGSDDSAQEPTASLSPIDAFELELGPDTEHSVTFGGISTIFEETPGAVEIEGMQTNEGIVADGKMAEIVGPDMPVRTFAVGRLLGDWLGYAIRDEGGEYLAYRLSAPRPDAAEPAEIQLEGYVADAVGTPRITGPTERFTGAGGVDYLPPEPVNIRGYDGYILKQIRTGGGEVISLQTVVWYEEGMYWSLSGWDPPAREHFTPTFLLEVAREHLLERDEESTTWLEVR